MSRPAQRVPTVQQVDGPCSMVLADGSRWTTRRTITTVNKWRKVNGMEINFGFAHWGRQEFVKIDNGKGA